MALNKVILIGNLTKDVEVKQVGEAKLANFTLAVNRRFKSKNANQPAADYIPVAAWRHNAEFAEKYFSKGKQVYVVGAIETYSYEQDGKKLYGFRINAEEVGFADTAKPETPTKPVAKVPAYATPGGFIPMESIGIGDDLPF